MERLRLGGVLGNLGDLHSIIKLIDQSTLAAVAASNNQDFFNADVIVVEIVTRRFTFQSYNQKKDG